MSLPPSPTVDKEVSAIVQEYRRARRLHGPMHSAHEGISVLREEFEELWDEVKMKHPDVDKMRSEVIQVGAMALAFLLEVCGGIAE